MAPNKKQFTLSFIVGLVLLPLSAIAAVALVGGDEPVPEAAVVETTIAAPTSTVAAIAAPAGLSERDVWQACVPDATALLEKETAETITDLERAALDALRAICADEGMPLSGPPALDAIVRTVTVRAPAPAAATVVATTTAPETESADDASVASDDDYAEDDAYAEDDDTYTEDDSEAEDDDAYDDGEEDMEDVEDPLAGQSQYLGAHAEAVAAIDAAVAANGNSEKIAEAREQLGEAEAKASNNDFWSALEKAMEAKDKAEEAISDREDD